MPKIFKSKNLKKNNYRKTKRNSRKKKRGGVEVEV